ncbi:transcriptional repressor [Oceanospirillum sediminis]|uniref:Transcriptional repressor n=1 Tax=Oceanospirillum sediminis TaxID=2760088 RepID=A0A839IR72_9GAMM|nr:transcriptional repressor [Oceanospirillum sediminis]MBB1487200.1 transcriptional repressor [Oceanospirillum sediminis]
MTDKPGIDETITAARTSCTQNGVRLTPKREKVLRVLLQNDRPLSAYDVVDLFKESFSENLPAMSAYRILTFLLENDFVHKLETTNQFMACRHICCDHLHEPPQFLICDKCNAVRELSIGKQTLNELNNGIEQSGFILVRKQLELHGLCKACQESNVDLQETDNHSD